MKKKKKFEMPEPMTDEQLREFVQKWCSGMVVSSADVPDHLLPIVFMPLALGAFEGITKAQAKEIGLVYDYIDHGRTFGRAVNGFPIFATCRLMLKSDRDRAAKAIDLEMDRRKQIEIPK